ncbi:RHS repeat domain-containing protein, partial [Chryseobacterium paridis]
DVNTAADVKKYVTVTSWASGTTASAISQSVNYAAGQLYKNTVTDEDGNKTIEFKNGKGQVVMVRKVINATDNADTYYVYNEYNQLAFVIPPKAAIVSDVNTVLGSLCYIYRYDGRNRLILKKLPGKDYEFMVYDKQDRLIMTQDAVMGASKQWLFTKYDQFGRVAYTGIYTSAQVSGTVGRATEQALADAAGSNNVARTTSVGFIVGGRGAYYSNNTSSYPNTITSLLSINYYDTYPVYSFNPTFPTNILGTPVITDNSTANTVSTKSLPVMTLVKNIEDNNWTSNYTYYDSKGRAIGSHSINHLGGYTRTESQLDFTGTVKQAITRHKRLATDTERVIEENFIYDQQNRLLTHTHKVDNNPVETLTQNEYNELSQLKSKQVGRTEPSNPLVGAAFLQQIDYKYNIRGWMTQINDPSTLGTDLFGYKIKYNQVEGLETPNMDYSTLKVKPRYNGNIAEVDWKTSTIPNDNIRRYGYVYDNLNRLLAGFYQKDTNPSGKEYFEKMDYDLNGNITNLKRSADLLSGDPTSKLIDNLKYDYIGNRLTKVTEQQQNSSGYPYFATPNAIGYDLNGNITKMEDKGISKINYNFLNLPNFFDTTGYGSSTYTYRADGLKIKRKDIFTLVQITTETDYLDGFQYENGLLKFVPTSEGYYNYQNGKYVYNYTDHLGNVRLSYQKGTSGIEITEENNYYPFGLKHEGYNVLAGNPSYQYKYNGKEYQSFLGMYDYGARFYMPDLGRWGVIDPLAERSRRWSPYNYAYNNPIRFIDPDGMQNEDWVKRGNQVFYDAAIKSQADAEAAYGKNTLHLGEGSKITTSVNGEVASQYTFHDNGTVSDMSGNTIDNTQNIDTEGGNTIFSNCSECLNPGTLGKNLLWLTYPGGDNPTTYGINGKGAKASYEYVPNFLSEYPAIGHDRRYDNLGTAGASGLLTDTRAIGADYNFVKEELQIALNPFVGILDRAAAGVLGVGLGIAAAPKTIFKIVTQPQFGPIQIGNDYKESSVGVTNIPKR